MILPVFGQAPIEPPRLGAADSEGFQGQKPLKKPPVLKKTVTFHEKLVVYGLLVGGFNPSEKY